MKRNNTQSNRTSCEAQPVPEKSGKAISFMCRVPPGCMNDCTVVVYSCGRNTTCTKGSVNFNSVDAMKTKVAKRDTDKVIATQR